MTTRVIETSNNATGSRIPQESGRFTALTPAQREIADSWAEVIAALLAERVAIRNEVERAGSLLSSPALALLDAAYEQNRRSLSVAYCAPLPSLVAHVCGTADPLPLLSL